MDEVFGDLIEKLKIQYDISGPYDLSPFFSKGNEWLFTFVKSLYKEQYNNNERIVLYFDHDDYRYSRVKYGELLKALQYDITEIDISHYFIILITSDNRVATELDFIRLEHNKLVDQYPITYYSASNIICSENTNDSDTDTDTICIKLWGHLYIKSSGDITPCCLAEQHVLGNILNDNISNIRNNSKYKQIRSDMLSKKRPIECKHCYEIEKHSTKSPRMEINNKSRFKLQQIKQKNSTSPLIISSIDIRVSNICNLKCRICSESCSSRIAKEQNIDTNTLNAKQRGMAMNDIIQYIPNISEIYFAGGEPLIMDEHYQILNELKKHSKLDIPVTYNTNLINLRYKEHNIIEYWKSMKNLTIKVSIDAINEQAKYLRNGTIWNQLNKNFLLITNQLPHANILIDSTISLHNAFHLIECHKQWLANKFINVNNLRVKVLKAPSCISISVLPKVYRNKLINLINDHIIYIKNIGGNIDEWNNVLTYLYVDKSYQLYEFFNITNKLDKMRDESFISTFPEYRDLENHINFNSPHDKNG